MPSSPAGLTKFTLVYHPANFGCSNPFRTEDITRWTLLTIEELRYFVGITLHFFTKTKDIIGGEISSTKAYFNVSTTIISQS